MHRRCRSSSDVAGESDHLRSARRHLCLAPQRITWNPGRTAGPPGRHGHVHAGGRWLVALAGLAGVAVGLVMVRQGWSAKFLRYFGHLPSALRGAVVLIGRVGTVARGSCSPSPVPGGRRGLDGDRSQGRRYRPGVQDLAGAAVPARARGGTRPGPHRVRRLTAWPKPSGAASRTATRHDRRAALIAYLPLQRRDVIVRLVGGGLVLTSPSVVGWAIVKLATLRGPHPDPRHGRPHPPAPRRYLAGTCRDGDPHRAARGAHRGPPAVARPLA